MLINHGEGGIVVVNKSYICKHFNLDNSALWRSEIWEAKEKPCFISCNVKTACNLFFGGGKLFRPWEIAGKPLLKHSAIFM